MDPTHDMSPRKLGLNPRPQQATTTGQPFDVNGRILSVISDGCLSSPRIGYGDGCHFNYGQEASLQSGHGFAAVP